MIGVSFQALFSPLRSLLPSEISHDVERSGIRLWPHALVQTPLPRYDVESNVLTPRKKRCSLSACLPDGPQHGMPRS